MIKGKLKIVGDRFVEFHCPGCKDTHRIKIGGTEHPMWSFNGDYDKPTFSPSILVRSGHYCDHANPDDCWCNFEQRFPEEGPAPFRCMRCHSFVRDGKIQFLGDCTHELAGKTVDLPDME